MSCAKRHCELWSIEPISPDMAQDPTPPLTEHRLEKLEDIPMDLVPSPGYVVHTDLLAKNCEILDGIQKSSGAKILLALKGYACHATFPIIREYLSGTTSSGLHEALLAQEFFGPEIHVYCPAYKNEDLERLSAFAHTLVFNSPQQMINAQKHLSGSSSPELGLRVNPEHSEVKTELYDPCSPNSRLGITRKDLDAFLEQPSAKKTFLTSLNGLHFHALCEQDSDALEHTIDAFVDRFGDLFPHIKWVNFGGGHHITRPGYDIDRLNRIIIDFRKRFGLEVYLEPGEAVALHTGLLVTTVLDILPAGGVNNAILDISATCHMPDVLEMPYRPNVLGAHEAGEMDYTYRLGGLSCLAGDVIGDYSFERPLEIGQKLKFLDMSHYTMVKTTTFNGVPLPSINTFSDEAGLQTIKTFGYEDYCHRLS